MYFMKIYIYESTGAPPAGAPPANFKTNAKFDKENLTYKQILNYKPQIKGIPYYKDVLSDVKNNDFSWEITQTVYKYAKKMLADHMANNQVNLPPIIIIRRDDELLFQDGAHRFSAIYLLANHLDEENKDIWENFKFNIHIYNYDDMINKDAIKHLVNENKKFIKKRIKGLCRR